MGISTLLGLPVEEQRNLFEKSSFLRKKEKLNLNLPKGYLFFSFSCRYKLERCLEKCTPLPRAIIVDLDVFSLNQVSSILNALKVHQQLSCIPIIGLANHLKKMDVASLLEAGLDDCFFKPLDWRAIQKRVNFISEFKQLQKLEVVDSAPEGYKIPLGKRAFDILVAGTVLTGLSPLLILVAILIKLESKGPLFYTSKRIGTGYQEFDFIKFRSMSADADKQLQKLAHLNSYDEKSTKTDTFFKIKNDPRVTRIGKIIRKTSIDELPQLLNVLRGEMSIIGNRPLPLYEAKKLTKDDWAKRFLAPAGLTGLWQVDERGKDNLSAEERVNLDVTYAKGVSFLMDIKILLKTVPAMWQRG